MLTKPSAWFMVVVLVTWLGLAAHAEDIETSIVRLDLNDRKISETFELVDLGEAVLLPLRATARLLDVEVELEPKAQTAKVTRAWDKQSGTVDLTRQVVRLGEQERPLDPAGMALAGDFFVPLAAAEQLFDIKAEWNGQQQVMRLSAGRELSLFKTPEKKTEQSATNRPVARQAVSAAPALSLGSVQYILTNGRTTDDLRWPVKDELRLDAHLQLFGVPLDVSGRAKNFSAEDRQWTLDRATATYSSPWFEIVAGDTTLDLGRVLQNADLRGVRFSAPEGWTSGQIYAVTTIEGWVTAGSEVELRVNGYFLGKETPKDGHYQFNSVPLQITRPNRVVLTITEPDGRQTTETRSIAATPRLLPKGEVQTAVGWGWVRGEEDGDGEPSWEAVVEGAAVSAGLDECLTVGAEVARRRDVDSEGSPLSPGVLAGDVGLALRTSDNLIFSLDWLMSRPEGANQRPAQGSELAANLQVGRSSWQSVIFYREEDLSLFSPLQPGVRGFRIIGEIELSRAWNLQTTFERSESLAGDEADPRIKAGAVLRWASPSGDSSVLKLEREVRGTDTAAWTYLHAGRTSELTLEAGGTWWEGEEEKPEFTGAKTKLELRRLLGKNSVGSLTRSDQIVRSFKPDDLSQTELLYQTATEGEISWFPGKNRLSLSGSLTDFRWLDDPADQTSQRDVAVDVSRSFGPATIGVAYELTQRLDPQLTDEAAQWSAYLWAKKRGTGLTGQLRADYVRPVLGVGYVESLKYTVRGGYQCRNGFFFGLEGYAERIHDGEPEYYAGVTLSQGLGFSNGGVRGFRAVGGRPMGYVEGMVYLDANRNGAQDRGEKGLPNVPVVLAGRRTKTDKEGYYCFEYVSPGTYQLGLDPNNLQADYTPLTEAKLVKLQANANYTQDFGVALNGTIEGVVFLDSNHDGTSDKSEGRLAWVRVLLDGKTETFTDEQGSFSFQNVDLGKHVLTIDPKSLAENEQTPEAVGLEIREDALDVWDVMIPVAVEAQH